jgi:hypothetical protein
LHLVRVRRASRLPPAIGFRPSGRRPYRAAGSVLIVTKPLPEKVNGIGRDAGAPSRVHRVQKSEVFVMLAAKFNRNANITAPLKELPYEETC